MKIVIFGLSVSSSRGNSHAAIWRGLCRGLARRGHEVVFFERDVPGYAKHRDLSELPGGGKLLLYPDWNAGRQAARRELADADVGIVTSYCPDALDATDELLGSPVQVRAFYDLDTPVTLERLARGQRVDYVGSRGFRDYDLVLSFAGGRALEQLRTSLGARNVAPLYASVDPEVHRPVAASEEFRADLSYLGTYSADRREMLQELFVEPARRLREARFLVGGPMYPPDFPWQPNLYYRPHVAPAEHPAFYCSSKLTLNVARGATAAPGFCPSVRLFEAAACGVPVLSDEWEGLDRFFEPGREILVAKSREEAIDAILLGSDELARIGAAARERALAEHTSDVRAQELVELLEDVHSVRKLERAPALSARRRAIWGIIPAAGMGNRIQPLAFSKELLPVGSRIEKGSERPRAVSEFLVERMVRGGAGRICFILSPGKSDILEYYGGTYAEAQLCYTVQLKPAGLCDAIFRAAPFVDAEDPVLVGLPDTVWFPEDGYLALGEEELSFLLFPVEHPERFDAVVLDEGGRVTEIQVKKPNPSSNWVWGAFKMPGRIFHELHRLWLERDRRDEYVGTLVNA